MEQIYPIRLQASLHETLWGGRNLEHHDWKPLPAGEIAIGEAWETETSCIILNGLHEGKTLGLLVQEQGVDFLGEQVIAIFGKRFPLLAKFIDANAQLSVQVHPKDTYAAKNESGKLGKTEFWYILAAEPGARIVYGFKESSNREAVKQAIKQATLESLLHEEAVKPGDVVFVPAGTVHAIGSGILLYELQEYSDVTYRMYDYARVSANGKPRELHIEKSLDVTDYSRPRQIKTRPVDLENSKNSYKDSCLVACTYFVTREINLLPQRSGAGIFSGRTEQSCSILSSLGADIQVSYGEGLGNSENLRRGETMVLPAKLGAYQITGYGSFLFSYVPTTDDKALLAWQQKNPESVL